jgi:hypothetical protein
MPHHLDGCPSTGAAKQTSSSKIITLTLMKAALHEAMVPPPCHDAFVREATQYAIGILPVPCLLSHHDAVTTAGIPVQSLQVFYKAGTDGVQMDIAHEFKHVRFFIAQDRFISILKKVAMSTVTPIERDGIPCEEPTHHLRDRHLSRLQDEMNMVGHQHPGITTGMRLAED